jgi:SRSO17 transposase
VIGHADREGPLRDYCTGLILPGERKSVEPMAAITAPERVSAQHQSLLHFIGQGGWSDENVMGKVREMVLPQMESSEPIKVWIIDDTAFPKQGAHSVGVARQYCGRLGKQDNCQVAVSLSLANSHASLPVAYRLYLPKEWAQDETRRRKAGVPDDITFKTKPEIALEQIQWAYKLGLPGDVVVMDAGYGANTDLRTNITDMGLQYVAGILPNTSVWEPGNEPLAPKKSTGAGRPAKLLHRSPEHQPVSVKDLALALPSSDWRTITWREGAAEALSSRFARVRVRIAHRDYKLTDCRPEEWLLIEWPEGEKEPTKYWLSTLPSNEKKRNENELRVFASRSRRKRSVGNEFLTLRFAQRGWLSRHDCRDLPFDAVHRLQRLVPAPFKLAGHQAVSWIDGIVLPTGMGGLVTRLLQRQFKLPLRG